MTEKLIRNENEAIEAIKSNIPTSGYYMLREALDMAISALEEIQQYRALGTVEELKIMKESALSGLELANIWAALEQLKKYESLGTLEELREAREKQAPKKPTEDVYQHKCCPNCDWVVYQDEWGGRYLPHCENCGQAIDWSDTE